MKKLLFLLFPVFALAQLPNLNSEKDIRTHFDNNGTEFIEGVDNGKELREKLRVSVEKRRDEKKVREVDFE